ncbi:four helix bundle protein [Hymenobacter latericus]|uniref:four helix bundle protein n=1 Tax=Hymenobacter sp. YIM 151858-1 TaxID=2987688 RepID=UPI002225C7AA|nr:four helix bundle protein [Hymenobacter sp. YIM 151858-1]UYZ57722.1 four helix bundle protein [Hymenobacter sp. YIM 151858-1]
MKGGNVVLDKSYAYSLRIVRLYLHLKSEKKPMALAEQVLRSGTSIGANIEEAVGGFSRKDFVAKCSIGYKEARETHYWIRLLRDACLIDTRLAESLLTDAEELKKLLASILLATRRPENSPNNF